MTAGFTIEIEVLGQWLPSNSRLCGVVDQPLAPVVWRSRRRRNSGPGSATPFTANAARRHHIPKQKRKITNWPAYGASPPICFADEAIAAWRAAPRTSRGGQHWYSPPAILTALSLRAVFRLALRQTEGLVGSIIALLGLAQPGPDHSTLKPTGRRLKCRDCAPAAVPIVPHRAIELAALNGNI